MTALETLVEELKGLPANKFDRAAEYVHGLAGSDRSARLASLKASAGCLTRTEGEAFERAIVEGCEKVHERDW